MDQLRAGLHTKFNFSHSSLLLCKSRKEGIFSLTAKDQLVVCLPVVQAIQV